MKELGLVMNLTDLGATEEMIPDIVKGTIILTGGYKVLTKEEVENHTERKPLSQKQLQKAV